MNSIPVIPDLSKLKLVQFYLLGPIPSKKNNKRIAKWGKKSGIISSKPYLVWAEWAVAAIARQMEHLDAPFPISAVAFIVCHFSYQTLRVKDSINTEEGVLDVLVEARVITDDRWTVLPNCMRFAQKSPSGCPDSCWVQIFY